MNRCAIILISLAASVSYAGPVAQPGDIGLRHEIQVLADYGVISGPVTTWPISWDALAADLQLAVDNDPVLPVAVERALQRLIARTHRETAISDAQFYARLAAAEQPSRIRGYANTPREEGEVSAGFSWFGERISIDINATGVNDADDGVDARADGSRIAIDLGNTTLAISTMDRWWGPGWDGSLILSNNARPVPAITLGRNTTNPFESKWLSWLGPWDVEVMMGQMEEDREIRDPRLFGMRFAFRPVPSLEIGLSRTAMWCGETRPCDASTFGDILIGKDNLGDDGATFENEPSNQLAGVDLRWSNLWFGQPMAIYVQAIGEDEAGGFPSRYTGLVGAETSGFIRNRWSYRWFAEVAATSCDFIKDDRWNCAYNHGIYQTGYRYRGRVIGHGVENDSKVISTGIVLVNSENSQWQALVRFGDLNRGGPADVRNTLTPTPLDIGSVDLRHSRSLGNAGWIDIGVGYERTEDPVSSEENTETRAFINWRSR